MMYKVLINESATVELDARRLAKHTHGSGKLRVSLSHWGFVPLGWAECSEKQVYINSF